MSETKNNDNFCGVIRTYHDEEKTKLKEEYFMMNGKKEGIYKLYSSNGELFSEVNYIDGKMNGVYKSYYSNGQLCVEENYIDGTKLPSTTNVTHTVIVKPKIVGLFNFTHATVSYLPNDKATKSQVINTDFKN